MARFLTRRNFLRTAALGTLSAGGAAAYTHWGEPHWLKLQHYAIPTLQRDRARVRFLHLSDFHASRDVSLEFIAEAIALGLAEKPDVIAVTGDFFTNRFHHPVADYVDVLRPLAAAAPTFACLGNHDGGPWTSRGGGYSTVAEVRSLLKASGIRCLLNEAVELTVRDRPLQIFGTGDLWSGMCFPLLAFRNFPARGNATRVLLNHNPDAKDALRPFDWDLVLCGHTHGGQIRLPFVGTPFAPVRDQRYVEGLHTWEGRSLFVTRGVGNLHGIRFNCRPEVSVLDI